MYIFIYKVVFHFNKFLMVEFNVLVMFMNMLLLMLSLLLFLHVYVCMYICISKFHSIYISLYNRYRYIIGLFK